MRCWMHRSLRASHGVARCHARQGASQRIVDVSQGVAFCSPASLEVRRACENGSQPAAQKSCGAEFRSTDPYPTVELNWPTMAPRRSACAQDATAVPVRAEADVLQYASPRLRRRRLTASRNASFRLFHDRRAAADVRDCGSTSRAGLAKPVRSDTCSITQPAEVRGLDKFRRRGKACACTTGHKRRVHTLPMCTPAPNQQPHPHPHTHNPRTLKPTPTPTPATTHNHNRSNSSSLATATAAPKAHGTTTQRSRERQAHKTQHGTHNTRRTMHTHNVQHNTQHTTHSTHHATH